MKDKIRLEDIIAFIGAILLLSILCFAGYRLFM